MLLLQFSILKQNDCNQYKVFKEIIHFKREIIKSSIFCDTDYISNITLEILEFIEIECCSAT